MNGLIHAYFGEGKGKTTAAVGLALRAAGAGLRVLFVQFFKDGSSSEVKVLRTIPNVSVLVCETPYGFYKFLSDEDRAAASADYTALLDSALTQAREGGYGLLVLDEVFAACKSGAIPEGKVSAFLETKPEGLEVAMTGRDAPPALLYHAAYITDMHNKRHPFEKGIEARKGVEY